MLLTAHQVRFTLDSETSDPTDVGVYEHKEANSMVEEFMLNPSPNPSPTPRPKTHPNPNPN